MCTQKNKYIMKLKENREKTRKKKRKRKKNKREMNRKEENFECAFGQDIYFIYI